MRLSLVCLALLACAALVSGAEYEGSLDNVDPALVVTIADGPLVGFYSTYSDLTARAWLGIPYAAPPNGTGRFMPPQPVQGWTGTRDATVAGPGCQQVCTLPPGLCPPVLSEDCLYVNVYAPAEMSGQLLPVMVFIHGGNFRQGSGATGMYDGTVFVNSSNVILVTMNYRLGALGFFFNSNTGANNGLLDQQMALQWVNQNIFSFGGDNTQVTIFGQSAGATSVSSHLQNPVSNKLFQRAILESLPLGIPVRFPDEAAKLNAIFAQLLNCAVDDLACLQAADIPSILAATGKASGQLGPDWKHLLEIAQAWEPTIQMPSFPIALPLTQFFQQYDQQIPLLIGTTSQEAYVFIYEALNSSMNILKAGALETVIFGLGALPELEKLYPLHALGDNRDPISDLAGDELFLCAARNATDGIRTSAPQVPVYLYQFDHVSQDGAHGWGPNYTICWTHVCHGSEVPYVFGSAEAGGSTFSADEWTLSQTMTKYWTNFATTGDPNKGQPVPLQWPQVGAERETMHFVTGELEIIQNDRGTSCDFFDTLGYTL